MRLLVSACLLGACCRYDGGSKPCPQVLALLERHTLFPVCPEQLGGLPTPRLPAERQGRRVVRRDGADVTAAYERGAQEAARLYALLRCEGAVLKSRSHSCGCGEIYDGSFTGAKIPGDGVTARLLLERGAPVYTEEMGEALSRL